MCLDLEFFFSSKWPNFKEKTMDSGWFCQNRAVLNILNWTHSFIEFFMSFQSIKRILKLDK